MTDRPNFRVIRSIGFVDRAQAHRQEAQASRARLEETFRQRRAERAAREAPETPSDPSAEGAEGPSDA